MVYLEFLFWCETSLDLTSQMSNPDACLANIAHNQLPRQVPLIAQRFVGVA